MKMNFKAAFRYNFKNLIGGSGRALLIIFGIILILTLFVFVNRSGATTITGMFAVTAAIFLFVMGIVGIRSDLRICLQFGVSRRTSFCSEIVAVFASSVILAAAGELLTGILQPLSNSTHFFASDLYQIIFLQGTEILSFSQHMISALFNLSLFICAYIGGMFFSLLFWRLNKIWTVTVAIAIPFLMNGIPILLDKLGVDFNPFLSWLSASPYHFVIMFLLIAAIVSVINWLVLRRANIKAAK